MPHARNPLLLTMAWLLAIAPAFAQHYHRVDLTADQGGVSDGTVQIDPNLVNAWGLSRASTSPWWISDNGTGLTTLYDGNGTAQPLVVKIPSPLGPNQTSAPTGTVFNFTTKFWVGSNAPAIFLFVTEDGTIAGWNPTVNPTLARTLVNRSKEAAYKGCALAWTANGARFYATNFKSGHVEVFDGTMRRLALSSSAFHDDRQNGTNFVPFNIQNIGGNLVVTFARRQPGADDEDHGPGLGFVSIFDTEGHLLRRLERGNFLNAPWGVVESPADFGWFSHRLLVGNFGDGTINVFNPISGLFEGKLLNQQGTPVRIDGLWALSFGSGLGKSGLATDLYFTAGPNDEKHGLFGKLTPVSTELRGNTE